MLQGEVLVLNRNFQAVHVTTVRRAFTQIYEGLARAVDREYRTFDFASWSELSAAVHPQDGKAMVTTPRLRLLVPRVIQLIAYDRMPRTRIRFSRLNIYARDANQCQYCGRRHARSDLNLDHVIPRSQGGQTTWENVVCSCVRCNLNKGGRTPAEAGMKLLKRPIRPRWTPTFRAPARFYDEWRPFLSTEDMAYWNTELLP